MDILTILINNGVGVACAAAMLWLAWYRETKTIPAMMRTFSDAQQRGTETLTELSKGMQEGFAERSQNTLNTFTQLVREERQVYQQWHEDNRGRIDNLAVEVKENRHLLRNLVQEFKLRNEVISLKSSESNKV